MIRTRLASLAVLTLVTIGGGRACDAQQPAAAKPPVPLSRPLPATGGLIALLGAGLDYTIPAITQSLARDGEGEIMGRDVIDDDQRPFDTSRGTAPAVLGGAMTELASLLAGTARLVPVRYDAKDPRSLVAAIIHVSRTPARVVIVTGLAGHPRGRAVIGEATARFPGLLFVVPAATLEERTALGEIAGLPAVLAVAAGGSTDRLTEGCRVQPLGFAGHPAAAPGHLFAAARLADEAARSPAPSTADAGAAARLKSELLARWSPPQSRTAGPAASGVLAFPDLHTLRCSAAGQVEP